MKTLFNILLLEDSDEYAETIALELQARIHARGKIHVHRVANELDFRRQAEALATQNFDLGVFDVMVNWCDIRDLASPDGLEPPPEVQAEVAGDAPYRGGIRCRELFREKLATFRRPDVPCIYYSILKATELRTELGNGSTPVVVKSGEFDRLIEKIDSLI